MPCNCLFFDGYNFNIENQICLCPIISLGPEFDPEIRSTGSFILTPSGLIEAHNKYCSMSTTPGERAGKCASHKYIELLPHIILHGTLG